MPNQAGTIERIALELLRGQKVVVEIGKVTEHRVTLRVTFLIKD